MEMERPKINYIVPITTGVIHQHDESSCVDLALADMCTIIFRMNGVYLDHDLTPQIGIDRNGSISASIRMCTHKDYGLEKLSVYPYSKLPRKIEKWTQDLFETLREQRYRLEYIAWIEKKNRIEPKLLTMFDWYGFRYPVVGIMYMGSFADPVVARHHATVGPPYRHAPGVVFSGARHAMLIVGLNTMSDNKDDHYCLVKNSYGEEWGEKGYSRVGIEVFVEILYPFQPRSTIRKRKIRERGRFKSKRYVSAVNKKIASSVKFQNDPPKTKEFEFRSLKLQKGERGSVATRKH
ncbi:transducin/WD40 repeat-like superfamily protein [Tanacetum coccineum]